jgi:outer membrane protein assembly factor BamB
VGYSAIVYDDGVLYTMYRKQITDRDEYVVALEADTGREIWKHKNSASVVEPPDQRWGGQGPNSTPLVVGDQLFAVGSRSVLHCFDKKTGEVHWKHDLVSEFGAPLDRHVGYCCSPIAYKDMVIVSAGRPAAEEGAAPDSQREGAPMFIAFEQATGKVAWKSPTYTVNYSSPIMINFAGRDQLVFCTGEGLIGVDPAKGDLLWHHRMEVRHASVTPVWNGSDVIFYTASGAQGSSGRAVRLIESAGQIVAEEAWNSRKVRIGQPTPVPVGDHFYGSTDRLLLAVNFETGKRVWAKRGFPTASCVHADGKLLILDQDGWLTLATATPEGLMVHSKCQVTEPYSFTVPTLVGTTLYVRDRKHIMALDVGKG